MKRIIDNYTFDASAKTITFAESFSIEGFQLITNVTDGVIIFQFNKPEKLGTLAGNVLTLVYDTTSMSDTDNLAIIYTEVDSELSPMAVTGTFWQATQPVSFTWSGLTDTELRASPVPVSGTFWQTTQPVSIASVPSHDVTNAGTFAVQVTSAPTTAVTGTFWQATQPVSLTSLPAFAAIPTFKIDQTTLGTTDSVTVKASEGIGSLTETAPGTDTASSGLNGRLQRIAQRITSLISLFPTSLGSNGGLKVDVLSGGGGIIPVIATNYSGTITTGGVAQNVFLASANEKGFLFVNTSNDMLYVSEGADASTASVPVPPGASVTHSDGLVTLSRLSVYGATTGQSYYAERYDAGLYRYLRAEFNILSNSLYLTELQYFDAANVEYPTVNMTSNVLPSPLVASTNFTDPPFAYLAFDGTGSGLLNNVGTGTKHVTIDLGSKVFNPAGGRATIQVSLAGGSINLTKIMASETGAFAGEEIVLWVGTQSLTTTHTVYF